MAERRMFAKTIIDSDAFLDMPLSAQALYFHLSMRADDDGFVNNPKKIQRMIGASDDDYKILIAKSFVLLFESGVIVIKHWRMNNYIRNDRYKETVYTEEMKLLSVKDNGAYTFGIPNDNQAVYQMDTQVRLGKDSIGKVSINNNINNKQSKGFVPPTLEEVKAYAHERGDKVNPQVFYDYFTAGNWKDSKGNPVKSWKQKMITWENNRKGEKVNERPKERTVGNTQSREEYEAEMRELAKGLYGDDEE